MYAQQNMTVNKMVVFINGSFLVSHPTRFCTNPLMKLSELFLRSDNCVIFRVGINVYFNNQLIC